MQRECFTAVLKASRILAAAIDANKGVLTPLWYELLEEAVSDGSIQTEYTKELSQLLPLINFWLMPSVYPATGDEMMVQAEKHLVVLSPG